MAHDLVIPNGMIIDGSGLDSFTANVGIVDGRNARVASDSTPAPERSTPRAIPSPPASSTATPT